MRPNLLMGFLWKAPLLALRSCWLGPCVYSKLFWTNRTALSFAFDPITLACPVIRNPRPTEPRQTSTANCTSECQQLREYDHAKCTCKKLLGNVSQNRKQLYIKKTRKNAIVEYLDYQIPVTQLYGDMQAAKRD